MRRRLRRDHVLALTANLPACVMGMEACGDHLGRALQVRGHKVRLTSPEYVRPRRFLRLAAVQGSPAQEVIRK
ncbi:MAG: hypothetical protein IPK78_09555 [Rhodospirillales bacterium]|nr:hypothetical protein [Rhodospirillales bacterium]